MKIANTLLLITPLVLATGCASQRHPVYATTYNGEIISSPPPVNPADRALADSVCQQFNRYGDLGALAPNIQVSAKDGIVTLTGTVPTEQDRKMIDAMVERTSGVVALNDQLQVSALTGSSLTASDTLLARRIQQTLRNRPEMAGCAPRVLIKDDNGIITLTGVVPSAEDRSRIEGVVATVPGVTIVNDDMVVGLEPTGRVAASPGEIFNLHVEGLSPTDRVLAQRVLDGLRTDTILAPLLPVVNINITSGRVNLQGTVQSEQQKHAIEAAVQRAAGVENVVDELQVYPR